MYEIHTDPNNGAAAYLAHVNQNNYANQWVTVGTFPMRPGGYVLLANMNSAATAGADIAMSAMAFTPASAGDQQTVQTAGGYSFQGWGTSLAWWANVVGGWTPADRAYVEQAMFGRPATPGNGEAKLGLNVARYNIGASQIGSTPTCPTLRPGAAVPSPEQTAGQTNLTADNNQGTVLAEADNIIRGAAQTPYYEAFANSPPWWMTSTQCPSGNPNPPPGNDANPLDNLPSGSYQAYADYLARIVSAYANQGFTSADSTIVGHKIAFSTVEPFNEAASGFAWPSASAPPNPDLQEGANLSQATQSAVLTRLCSESGLGGTKVSVPDENTVDATLSDLQYYQAHSSSCFGQINAHGYSGTAPYAGFQRGALHSAAGGTPTWMSEFGSGDVATAVSAQIAKDVQLLRPSSWAYWQGVDDPHGRWGLLQSPVVFPGDVAPGLMTVTDRFWAMAQYSQFIPSGSTIYTVSDPAIDQSGEKCFVLTVAARDPQGRVILVSTNAGQSCRASASRSVSFDIGQLGLSSGWSVQGYRTLDGGAMQKIPSAAIVGSTIQDFQPAQSISTYVISPAGVPGFAATQVIAGGGARPVVMQSDAEVGLQAPSPIPSGPSGAAAALLSSDATARKRVRAL